LSKDVDKANKLIKETCDELAEFLQEKNRKYGNSALSPLRLFSKVNLEEQLNVRMDDKLSRLRSAQEDDAEDAEADLLGYLILKRVAKKLRNETEEKKWVKV
jgi:hypothetical protein